jgi:hypothetical protein
MELLNSFSKFQQLTSNLCSGAGGANNNSEQLVMKKSNSSSKLSQTYSNCKDLLDLSELNESLNNNQQKRLGVTDSDNKENSFSSNRGNSNSIKLANLMRNQPIGKCYVYMIKGREEKRPLLNRRHFIFKAPTSSSPTTTTTTRMRPIRRQAQWWAVL